MNCKNILLKDISIEENAAILRSPLEVTHYSGKAEVGDVKKSANHKVRSDIVRFNSRGIAGRFLSGGFHP